MLVRWRLLRKMKLSNPAYGQHRIYEYSSVVERMLQRPAPSYKRLSCVTPAWDNSPRRKSDAVVLDGSTPDLYSNWLRAVIGQASHRPPEENLVFINAWNEWGEGNHLEPCQRWERGYLEATLRAVLGSGRLTANAASAAALDS